MCKPFYASLLKISKSGSLVVLGYSPTFSNEIHNESKVENSSDTRHYKGLSLLLSLTELMKLIEKLF